MIERRVSLNKRSTPAEVFYHRKVSYPPARTRVQDSAYPRLTAPPAAALHRCVAPRSLPTTTAALPLCVAGTYDLAHGKTGGRTQPRAREPGGRTRLPARTRTTALFSIRNRGPARAPALRRGELHLPCLFGSSIAPSVGAFSPLPLLVEGRHRCWLQAARTEVRDVALLSSRGGATAVAGREAGCHRCWPVVEEPRRSCRTPGRR